MGNWEFLNHIYFWHSYSHGNHSHGNVCFIPINTEIPFPRGIPFPCTPLQNFTYSGIFFT